MSEFEFGMWGLREDTAPPAGQDLIINAPCAAAEAVAPMHEPEEAGDGLD